MLSTVYRNIALLWTFHLQELKVEGLFHYVLSPLSLTSYCFSVTGNNGYSVAKISALGLEGARVQKLLKALFNNIPPYSAVTHMNRIGLHSYRIYTQVPIPPYKA